MEIKLNIQKTKIMASGPIILWEIDGETMKQWLTQGASCVAPGKLGLDACGEGAQQELLTVPPSNRRHLAVIL